MSYGLCGMQYCLLDEESAIYLWIGCAHIIGLVLVYQQEALRIDIYQWVKPERYFAELQQ